MKKTIIIIGIATFIFTGCYATPTRNSGVTNRGNNRVVVVKSIPTHNKQNKVYRQPVYYRSKHHHKVKKHRRPNNRPYQRPYNPHKPKKQYRYY